MVKRKNEAPQAQHGKSKKRAISDDEARENFREGLFEGEVLRRYREDYGGSEP